MARIANQRERLSGIALEGPLEVAHCVYEMCAGILDSNQLKYIPPGKCITRVQEIISAKPPREFQLDSISASLKLKDGDSSLECNTTTELEVLQALTRRSLAMDAVGMLDYTCGMRWVNALFSILQQSVAPGFNKVSVVQLLRTDRQAFMRMAEICNKGIQPLSNGVRPLDDAMNGMRNDSMVMFYMLPSQASSSSVSWAKHTNKRKQSDKSEVSNPPEPHHVERPKSAGKGKGKKSKGSGCNSGKLTKCLKGCVACRDDGERLCFSFNLDGCSYAKAGEKCMKGWHLCCKRGCFLPHPQHVHPS